MPTRKSLMISSAVAGALAMVAAARGSVVSALVLLGMGALLGVSALRPARQEELRTADVGYHVDFFRRMFVTSLFGFALFGGLALGPGVRLLRGAPGSEVTFLLVGFLSASLVAAIALYTAVGMLVLWRRASHNSGRYLPD